MLSNLRDGIDKISLVVLLFSIQAYAAEVEQAKRQEKKSHVLGYAARRFMDLESSERVKEALKTLWVNDSETHLLFLDECALERGDITGSAIKNHSLLKKHGLIDCNLRIPLHVMIITNKDSQAYIKFALENRYPNNNQKQQELCGLLSNEKASKLIHAVDYKFLQEWSLIQGSYIPIYIQVAAKKILKGMRC